MQTNLGTQAVLPNDFYQLFAAHGFPEELDNTNDSLNIIPIVLRASNSQAVSSKWTIQKAGSLPAYAKLVSNKQAFSALESQDGKMSKQNSRRIIGANVDAMTGEIDALAGL
ncbi:hypothetical protein E6O75_ATG03566 [Venturia nashicola]|uniref:Uncharacterized protein n=1 Tax=Venturia nashicola TaxID=86259 RepID=A0A4Z1P8Y7_9PEZI|nr:hypothetical protein E6O75_ATG03566 [Venturia nashicola]